MCISAETVNMRRPLDRLKYTKTVCAIRFCPGRGYQWGSCGQCAPFFSFHKKLAVKTYPYLSLVIPFTPILLDWKFATAESQKPRQRVSIAVRKVFAKIRKVFAIRWILLLSAHIHTKTVWITQKLSGQPQNCPDNPKTFRTIQKPSGHSRNCPDNLEMSG